MYNLFVTDANELCFLYTASPQCEQVQEQLEKNNFNSITFQEGKATLHQSSDCRHTHPFSRAPALGGLAKDMRRLQAVNKVEPIG